VAFAVRGDRLRAGDVDRGAWRGGTDDRLPGDWERDALQSAGGPGRHPLVWGRVGGASGGSLVIERGQCCVASEHHHLFYEYVDNYLSDIDFDEHVDDHLSDLYFD
jgi:hypothetical protein